MCIASPAPKHNKHIALSVYLLIPFNCHNPASSHAILLLSFLGHHSIYSLLPQPRHDMEVGYQLQVPTALLLGKNLGAH